MVYLQDYYGSGKAIRKKSVVLFALGMCLITTTPCKSNTFAYRGTFTTLEANDIFSLTNLGNNQDTLFGPSGVGQIKSLEFSPFDGYLYGLNPSMSFYRIDTTTGQASLIKSNIIGGFGESNLAFAQDGTLYAMREVNNDGNIGSLFTIDILTGDVTEVVGSSMPYGTTAFAINSQGVGIAWNFSDKWLYEINLDNGSINVIGSIDWADNQKFLAFDYAPDGTLYGSKGSSFYFIDTNSSTAVKGGNFQVGGGEGFTIIPEPASLSFLLFGSLAIFHRRKRK